MNAEKIKALLTKVSSFVGKYIPAESVFWTWTLCMAAIASLTLVLYKNNQQFDSTEIKSLLEWGSTFVLGLWLRSQFVTPVNKTDATVIKEAKKEDATIVVVPKQR